MKNSVIVLSLALLSASAANNANSVFAQDRPSGIVAGDQLVRHVQQGERAASRGDWEAAVVEFAAAVKANPGSAVAYYDLGVAQAHYGTLEDAVLSVRRAVAIDPKFSDAYVELGWILSELQQFDEAIATEKKALQINPSNRAAARNLQAIVAAKNNAITGRGVQFPPPAMAGNTAAASPRVSAAASPIPVSRIAGLPAGSSLHIADAAATDRYVSRQALRLEFDAAIAAGESAYKHHDLEGAKQNFQKAVEFDGNNAAAHADLGVVLGSLGDLDREVAEEKRAVALDAKNPAALLNLAWALGKKQRWSEALTYYQRVLVLSPNSTQAQVGQGLALFFMGKAEAGIAAVRVAKLNSPRRAEPYIAMGTMFRQQGRNQEAEAELKAALRLAPDNLEAKQQLGAVLLQADKSEQAMTVFKDLIVQVPTNATAHAGLSMALEMKGDSAGAEAEARKALDLNPKLQLAQSVLERSRLAAKKQAEEHQ